MSFRRLIYGLVALLLLIGAAVAVIAAPASSGARAPASSNVGAARFVLLVDGRDVAVFGDLVGLTSGFETSQLELTVGGSAPKLNLPGKRTPPAVVLKRGMTSEMELWDWHDDAIQNGARAWKDATIVMFDYDGSPVASWSLINAWPSKVELETETLAGGGQNIPFEKVTLVSERLVRMD